MNKRESFMLKNNSQKGKTMNIAIRSITHTFLPENAGLVTITISTDINDEWMLFSIHGVEGQFAIPMLNESDALSTFEFGNSGIAFTAGDVEFIGVLADEFITFLDNQN
jgi:hypothetical protein